MKAHYNSRMNTEIRQPEVSGMFYPGNREQLVADVDAYILSSPHTGAGFPKAIIAPHAGYPYSGPIAGSAFRQWQSHGHEIERVVLIGPSHYVAFDGMALCTSAMWATPLGNVTVDMEAIDLIRGLKAVDCMDAAHTREHCLEVEIPFLQRVLPECKIVPLVTGDVEMDSIANVLLKLWDLPGTVIVVSSDLSHYLDYATAIKTDRITADSIEEMQPDAIHPHQACGRLAIQGLLLAAQARKLKAVTADLRNSGDTAGRKDRVVGYGAFHFLDN